MESLDKKDYLTGAEQKIEEYVNRIKNGESKDSIFQDLPESFKSGIEKRLAEPIEEKTEQGINEIPPQYKGLDSETLDFIWTFPEYIDQEKTKELKEKKARALAALREKESFEKDKEERYQTDQKKIEELRRQIGLPGVEDQPANSEGSKSLEEDIEQLIDHRVNIDFNTRVFNEKTNQVEEVVGQSDIIDFAGRKIVVLDVHGKYIPFYLSTGHGGKADVTSGKWYPVFGIDPNEGWLNKLSGKEINDYYGSSILRKISERLDKKIGDIRDRNNIQKVGAKGTHIGIINRDLAPVENEKADTREKLEKNIKEIIDYLRNLYRDGNSKY